MQVNKMCANECVNLQIREQMFQVEREILMEMMSLTTRFHNKNAVLPHVMYGCTLLVLIIITNF